MVAGASFVLIVRLELGVLESRVVQLAVGHFVDWHAASSKNIAHAWPAEQPVADRTYVPVGCLEHAAWRGPRRERMLWLVQLQGMVSALRCAVSDGVLGTRNWPRTSLALADAVVVLAAVAGTLNRRHHIVLLELGLQVF